MTTIGDVFAIISLIAGIGFTAWALILGFTLMFPSRAAIAQERFERKPITGFGIGIATLLVFGLLAIACLSIQIPLLKLTGTLILATLISVSVMGCGGLVLLLGRRICTLEPDLSLYGSLLRATMILVVAMFFPVVGWFLLGPAILIASLGIGVQTVFTSVKPPVMAQ